MLKQEPDLYLNQLIGWNNEPAKALYEIVS